MWTNEQECCSNIHSDIWFGSHASISFKQCTQKTSFETRTYRIWTTKMNPQFLNNNQSISSVVCVTPWTHFGKVFRSSCWVLWVCHQRALLGEEASTYVYGVVPGPHDIRKPMGLEEQNCINRWDSILLELGVVVVVLITGNLFGTRSIVVVVVSELDGSFSWI